MLHSVYFISQNYCNINIFGTNFLLHFYNLYVSVLTLLDNTLHKWIASEAWCAYTCYSMANNLALCICPT